MKWSKIYLDKLVNNSFHYQEDLDFSNEEFHKGLGLLSLKDVHVEGNAKYDSYQERLMLDLLITGVMVIPCARTLEPVDYKFSINQPVTYSFTEDENDPDLEVVKGNEIDTFEYIRECIILEVPIQVFKEGSKPIEQKEETEVDPRLAKLKEYFNK